MDTVQWPQEIVVKPIEEIKPAAATGFDQRKARPQKEQALNCPRCNSTNTKFCYYNNYSLTQPRYFCKTCRRYWTEGGSLRNIPVGGGSRKNKRSSISSNSSSSSAATSCSNSSSSKKLPDLITPSSSTTTPPLPPPPPHHHQNPNKIHDGQDLNLAFPCFSTATTTTTSGQLSALELLTGISSRGLNSFMPNLPVQDPNSVYTSGFPLQDFKPTLSFSLDGIGNGYGSLHGVQESSSGRLLFPFEDLKQSASTTTDIHQNREHGDSAGYWTGMLGGGGGGGGGGSW